MQVSGRASEDFWKQADCTRPIGWKRTKGLQSGRSNDCNAWSSLRWHSPQRRTESRAVSWPSFSILRSESERKTASTCALPGPWHLSHWTPGTTGISDFGSPEETGIIVLWHPTQRRDWLA